MLHIAAMADYSVTPGEEGLFIGVVVATLLLLAIAWLVLRAAVKIVRHSEVGCRPPRPPAAQGPVLTRRRAQVMIIERFGRYHVRPSAAMRLLRGRRDPRRDLTPPPWPPPPRPPPPGPNGGFLQRTLTPGLHFIIPIVDRWAPQRCHRCRARSHAPRPARPSPRRINWRYVNVKVRAGARAAWRRGPTPL